MLLNKILHIIAYQGLGQAKIHMWFQVQFWIFLPLYTFYLWMFICMEFCLD